MITEEKIVSLLKEYGRLSKKELKKLILKSNKDYVPVEEALKKLKREKYILRDQLGRYYFADQTAVKGKKPFAKKGKTVLNTKGKRNKGIEGKIALVKNKYAFFEGDNGIILYISGENLMGAMLNDRVIAVKTGDGNTDCGEVIKILKRTVHTVVGTIENKNGEIYLAPDDYKLNVKIKLDKKEGLPENFKAVAEIYQYFGDGREPLGRITEILGEAEKPGAEMLSVLREHNIPDVFPQAVIDEAERIEQTVGDAQIAQREDLRGERIFTIDGMDAKDLDDAVSIKMSSDDYILGVHIADVSYYVRPDSALDGEAFKRGTSVYFPGSVIPMLPPRLSNGICSLNPNADRLTLSCVMRITPDGEIISYRIFKSVIRSCERLVYEDINKLLEGDLNLKSRYLHIFKELTLMRELAIILKKRRNTAGSLDFNAPEPEFTLDEEGQAIDVRAHERGISNMMIEEFMLACNRTVAVHMQKNGLPSVYRIHEKPEKSKVESFLSFIRGYGYNIKAKNLSEPKDYARLLFDLKGKPEERAISRLMLRTMQKAKYSSENTGHFGLAAQDYLHFTSPIRRYPDLIVHRMIHFSLENPNALEKWARRLSDIAAHSSERERAAQEAEWDGDDIKKAEYMSKHIGEKFEGVISGMCSTAFWVELENTVEGMVPLSSLKDDFYVFDQEKYILTGRHTGRRYKLGQSVLIKVTGASIRGRSVSFELAETVKNI